MTQRNQQGCNCNCKNRATTTPTPASQYKQIITINDCTCFGGESKLCQYSAEGLILLSKNERTIAEIAKNAQSLLDLAHNFVGQISAACPDCDNCSTCEDPADDTMHSCEFCYQFYQNPESTAIGGLPDVVTEALCARGVCLVSLAQQISSGRVVSNVPAE